MAAISATYPQFFDEPSNVGFVRKVALACEYPVHFTREVFSWENLTLIRALTRRAPRGRHALIVVLGSEVAARHSHLSEDIARYVEVHRERLALGAVLVADPRAAAISESICAAVDHAGGSVALVAVGGRSLQQAVGHMAASTRTPLLRVPTSVLAQAELAAAVDPGSLPLAVLCDFEFLRTLPSSSTRAGFAAAVECALCFDASFFRWLRVHARSLANGDHDTICELVRRCATPHVERRHRAIEFARWAAPVLAGELPHGEALALAIAIDAARSSVHGLFDSESLDTVVATMDLLELPTASPVLDREEVRRALVERMAATRASSSALLDGIGTMTETDAVDEGALLQAIEWLRHRASGLRRR